MSKEEWKGVKEAVVALVGQISKLANDLQKSRLRMEELRNMEKPVATDSWACLVLPEGELLDKWKEIGDRLKEVLHSPFDPEMINGLLPESAFERFRFIKDVKENGFSCKGYRVTLYTQVYKNNLESIHFMWLYDQDPESHRRAQRSCEQEVPKYHSRILKRKFVDIADRLAIKPCKARLLYNLATDDASSGRTLAEDEVDKRLEQYVMLKDETIIYDLRALNKSKEIYTAFFNKAEEVINTEVELAVDDRRHDQVVHLAKAMSTQDLFNQVKSKLPDDTPVPSLEWFRLQFYPRHSRYNTSKRYTARLQVKHMIQQRQLRSNHPDEHFCNALFKYIREFAMKYKQHTSFFSLDDKCKVNLGEPDYPIAAVARGKQVLVGLNEKFMVGDHDFSRGSLIPSVTLHVNFAENGSWYDGTPYLCLKDAVFQPSNPRRHAAEFCKLLAEKDISSPILLLYTDGGPDHRCDFLSVMYSMIYCFVKFDLDFLVLARNAPGHSWRNPAERIMSVLNLALQSVGMMRQAATSEDLEQKIKRCSTMKQLRAEADKTTELKDAWTDCIQDPMSLLATLFSRQKWKENYIKVGTPASDDEVEGVLRLLCQSFDSSISDKDTKADLRNRPQINEFLESHAMRTKYCFSVKKCAGPCQWCTERRLPEEIFASLKHIPMPTADGGDHYRSFEEAYEHAQTDERETVEVLTRQCPRRRVNDIDPSIKASAQNAKTVRRFITCVECRKPRVVYANHKLRPRQLAMLDNELEQVDFVCGTNLRDVIDDNVNHIFNKVSMRLFECSDEVETSYHSSGIFPAYVSH